MYLTALHAPCQAYHWTSSSNSYTEESNLQQINTHKDGKWHLQTAVYDMAYAYSMPCRYPFSQWLPVLQEVHKSIVPGGKLRILLVDLMPCNGTAGNILTRWINENVIEKLNRMDSCLTPTRRLPQLLAKIGARGTGSRNTKIKFYASQDSVVRDIRDPDPSVDRLRQDLEAEARIRTLTGRLLWTETWGNFLDPPPQSWWWEDEDCMRECVSLRTCWDIHRIETAKPSNDI